MSLLLKKLAIAALALSAVTMTVFVPNRSGAAGMPRDDAGKIFKAKCAMCHGADGSGNSPMGKRLK